MGDQPLMNHVIFTGCVFRILSLWVECSKAIEDNRDAEFLISVPKAALYGVPKRSRNLLEIYTLPDDLPSIYSPVELPSIDPTLDLRFRFLSQEGERQSSKTQQLRSDIV
jgi:hypothetical protein